MDRETLSPLGEVKLVESGRKIETFVRLLIEGDEKGCRGLIEEALVQLPGRKVLFQLLEPALYLLKEQAPSLQLKAIELDRALRTLMHCLVQVASALTEEVLAQGRRALILPLDSSYSTVSAEMLYFVLQADGCTVDYLSPHTEVEEFQRFVEKQDPELIAIVLLDEALEEYTTQLAKLRSAVDKEKPFVFVGSPHVEGSALADVQRQVQSITRGVSETLDTIIRIIDDANGPLEFDQILLQLSKRIRTRRKELSLSQDELSRAAELSRAYLSSVENARVNPSLGTVYKIAEILQIPLHELLEV